LTGVRGAVAAPPALVGGGIIPSLNKTLVLELARSEYVTRRENIIAVGRN
jgi:hypothetical protein